MSALDPLAARARDLAERAVVLEDDGEDSVALLVVEERVDLADEDVVTVAHHVREGIATLLLAAMREARDAETVRIVEQDASDAAGLAESLVAKTIALASQTARAERAERERDEVRNALAVTSEEGAEIIAELRAELAEVKRYGVEKRDEVNLLLAAHYEETKTHPWVSIGSHNVALRLVLDDLAVGRALRLGIVSRPSKTLYAGILCDLYRARQAATLSQEEESRFAGRLEDLWHKLTPEEQHRVEHLADQHKHTAKAEARKQRAETASFLEDGDLDVANEAHRVRKTPIDDERSHGDKK